MRLWWGGRQAKRATSSAGRSLFVSTMGRCASRSRDSGVAAAMGWWIEVSWAVRAGMTGWDSWMRLGHFFFFRDGLGQPSKVGRSGPTGVSKRYPETMDSGVKCLWPRWLLVESPVGTTKSRSCRAEQSCSFKPHGIRIQYSFDMPQTWPPGAL